MMFMLAVYQYITAPTLHFVQDRCIGLALEGDNRNMNQCLEDSEV